MKKMLTTGTLAIGLIGGALLNGCGGGSSSTDDTTTVATNGTTATLSGTVPGTLIEAFCTDGSYLSTTSVQNGTSQHPFALQLPVNVPCRIVMTMNENDPAQRVATTITFQGKSALAITGDTDLGYVDLPKTYAEAVDANGDHVMDIPVDITPAALNGTIVDDDQNPYDTDGNGHVDKYEDHNGNGEADGFEEAETPDGTFTETNDNGDTETATEQNYEGTTETNDGVGEINDGR